MVYPKQRDAWVFISITVSYVYDNRNLLTNRNYSDATPDISYLYDQYGARTSMTDGEGTTGYSYNNFRQLLGETRTFTSLTNKFYNLGYTWNLADQVKSVKYDVTTGGGLFGPLSGSTYTISGKVKNQQGQGVSGVEVRLQGTQSSIKYTDSFGNYSFNNLPAGGNYTVTPSKPNYSFSPTFRTWYNLQSNKTFQDFTAIPNTYTISGYVTDTGGQPINQATIALSGSQSGSTSTDGNGYYSIPGLVFGGNYTVTPSKLGYKQVGINFSVFSFSICHLISVICH